MRVYNGRESEMKDSSFLTANWDEMRDIAVERRPTQ
jgi:hypothetical protein